MKKIYEDLKTRFEISGFTFRHDKQAFLTAKKEQAVALITHLRDNLHYAHLVMMTCVDWLEDGVFQLTYILHSHTDHTDIGIKVMLSRETPVMEGIHHLWEQARVYQRELHEMFGLDFPGSPGMTEPMILEGWQGPPVMRRDFDTKQYSDETYSHRPREMHEPEDYMKQQLYPED